MAEAELPEEYSDYDMGTMEDAMVSDDDIERKYLVDEANEKVWWFDLKEVSWAKKNSILSDSVEQQGGEGKLQADAYYRDMMKAMTVEWSGESGLLGTFLTGLRAELGEQLEQWIPEPAAVQSGDEEEEGNSETQSSSPEAN